jgi:hypothetical protein
MIVHTFPADVTPATVNTTRSAGSSVFPHAVTVEPTSREDRAAVRSTPSASIALTTSRS